MLCCALNFLGAEGVCAALLHQLKSAIRAARNNLSGDTLPKRLHNTVADMRVFEDRVTERARDWSVAIMSKPSEALGFGVSVDCERTRLHAPIGIMGRRRLQHNSTHKSDRWQQYMYVHGFGVAWKCHFGFCVRFASEPAQCCVQTLARCNFGNVI